MVTSFLSDVERTTLPCGRIAACGVALLSFLRGLPLLFSDRPKTPLRILCIMAFDTVLALRGADRMTSRTRQTLAALLDFGACANKELDGKEFSLREYQAMRRLLAGTRAGELIEDYADRLSNLENERPAPNGGVGQFCKAQRYREEVVRLSLAMIAATVLDNTSIDDGIQATQCEEDLDMLYRIVMLCQIIDDVLDFETDVAAGLPSFLTAHVSLPDALALTEEARRQYAGSADLLSSRHLFPFRVALAGVSVVAKAVIFGRWLWMGIARVSRVFMGRRTRVSFGRGAATTLKRRKLAHE